jgi:hypothetical protein
MPLHNIEVLCWITFEAFVLLRYILYFNIINNQMFLSDQILLSVFVGEIPYLIQFEEMLHILMEV